MRIDKMKEAKVKASKYCVYQERSQQEVRDKLYALGLYSEEVEEVLTQLIIENFVNEERYAKIYARGKFKLKHWGRVKIEYELKRKKISPYCIREAMKEIPDEDYRSKLAELVSRKVNSYSEDVELVQKNKTARYLISKGYEAELVWACLNDHF